MAEALFLALKEFGKIDLIATLYPRFCLLFFRSFGLGVGFALRGGVKKQPCENQQYHLF